MGKQLFLGDNIRNRLATEAYNDEIPKEIVKKVIENNSISDDIPDFRIYTKNDPKSGLDVYAIHFYDKSINEVYFFVRGTEVDQFNDIYADAVGIVAGKNIDQLRALDGMYRDVVNKIKTENKLSSKEMENVSLNLDGHSLGGNQVTSLSLKYGTFQTVRGLNDAPVNVYQMFNFDLKFRESVDKRFDSRNIESIDEQELLSFAAEYYKENSANITHIRVKGEPLYTQSFPGKLYPGQNIDIIEPNEFGTREFPDIGTYPLNDLAKFNSFFRSEKSKYDSGVRQIINSVRYIDGKFVNTAEASTFFDSQLELWKNDEYMKFFTETSDIISQVAPGARSLISSPLGVAFQYFAVENNIHKMEYHQIGFLSELYSIQVPKQYYQFVVDGSGETILLEKETIKEFIVGCYQALETKISCIEDLDNYIENIVMDLYNEELRDLNKKLDRKEANPEAFNQEVGLVSAVFFNNGKVIIDSLTFERDFEPMRNSVTEPLYKMRETLENQRKKLEDFIYKVISLGEKVFEKDENLAAIIRKVGR